MTFKVRVNLDLAACIVNHVGSPAGSPSTSAAGDTHPVRLAKQMSSASTTVDAGANKHAFISSIHQSVHCHSMAAFKQQIVFESIFTHISLITHVQHKWNWDVVNKHNHCSNALVGGIVVINPEEMDFKKPDKANQCWCDGGQQSPPLKHNPLRLNQGECSCHFQFKCSPTLKGWE